MADEENAEAAENVEGGEPAEDEEGEMEGEEEETPTKPAEVVKDEAPPEEEEIEYIECPSESEVESMDSVAKELSRICDPDLRKNYIEYIAVVKEIETQNKIIQKIKKDMHELCCKPCRTKCDERDIRALRCCYTEESEKLTCLMQKAIQLQSLDPSRNFKNINLETTFDEDMMVVSNVKKKSRRRKQESSQEICNEKDEAKSLKKLEKTINKMQESIELIKAKVRSLSNNQDDFEDDFPEEDPKLKTTCKYLEAVEKNATKSKSIEVDEGICGDVDDADHLQCIIKQQSNLLEEYTKKYNKVQQQISEQNAVIEKVNANFKNMEDHINSEVQRMKAKFLEKFNDLADYPALLETTKQKIAQSGKVKDQMECKLRTLCKKLKDMKSARFDQETGPPQPKTIDCKREELKTCVEEQSIMKAQIECVRHEIDKMNYELNLSMLDLEMLRCESAKNISKVKGESNCLKQTFQDILERTEKELGECKASSCLAVAERDETIKEMRKQINTLAFSFDAAQKEIQALKQKVFFLTKDTYKPVLCDL